jgi:hypothetical protein
MGEKVGIQQSWLLQCLPTCLEKTLAGAWNARFNVDCCLCIGVMILVIPYVEYPAPPVNIIKDRNTEF